MPLPLPWGRGPGDGGCARSPAPNPHPQPLPGGRGVEEHGPAPRHPCAGGDPVRGETTAKPWTPACAGVTDLGLLARMCLHSSPALRGGPSRACRRMVEGTLASSAAICCFTQRTPRKERRGEDKHSVPGMRVLGKPVYCYRPE